ncbi:sporulation membrane protein YtrI [Priestia abyssalis]|uniref:sporulation membrane protein YtrI n=1 Tax=Priestia abyssalis TaxID=1221450 RepID=UPI001115BC3F|nr:sporulation membrane protein YtrI [Priestia abyssalis]
MADTGAYWLMRIPPLYKNRNWQRFLAGMILGAVVSWFVFLMLFGISQERQIITIHQQKKEIQDLKDKMSIWQNEIEELNEEKEENLVIQDLKVKIMNEGKYKINSYTAFLIQESAKEEIEHVLSKNIEDVYKSRHSLKKAIENKAYTIDKTTYYVEIHEIFFHTTLSVQLKIKDIKQNL